MKKEIFRPDNPGQFVKPSYFNRPALSEKKLACASFKRMNLGSKHVNDKLDLISAALAQKMGAKQIILFGSKADATDRPESDLDLCVIADLKNKRKIDFMRDARRELLDLISDPLDLLVYDEEDFVRRAKLRNTLEHKIMRDGIKIHG